MEIRRIEKSDIPIGMMKYAKKAGVLPPLDNTNCYWFGAFNEHIVGFSMVKLYPNNTALLKCAYVIPEYRRKKIHQSMINIRLLFAKNNGCIKAFSNLLEAATYAHFKDGARVISKRGNLTKIVYEL